MRSTSRTCATSVVAALLLLTPIAADEKETFYQPIEKNLEGWTIKVDPQLVKGEHAELGDKALSALANHLQRIKFILDEKRVAVLQKRPIWIERDNPKIRGMQYHPGRGWLIAHDLDPHLVKHVHIPQAGELLTRQVWAKHPYVILHELAHAYHDQVLSFDQAKIIQVFEEARDKGIYDKVLLYTGQNVRHYALSNHKEYFAEMTESYLGVNDFYPFVRAELKEHDPKMFALMQEIWGKIR
ncbi:MAG: metallopeptidase [Pirellulaceae bacterium]